MSKKRRIRVKKDERLYDVLQRLVVEVDNEFMCNTPELTGVLAEAKVLLGKRSTQNFEKEFYEEDERAIMQDEIDRYGYDVYCEHAGITDITFAELDNVTYNDAGEPIGYC